MNRIFYSAQTNEAIVDNKNVIQFASNCYLGLSTHKHVISRAISAIENYGTTSGGSRWISGNYKLILDFENAIAKYTKTDDAMIFSSGYITNLGTISSLCDQNDYIFSDELNHASIIDGIKLSRAKVVVYKHNDMKDLQEKLHKYSNVTGLIVTDSVFSMDGDIADIPTLIALSKKYKLKLMIDEAHSLGILGRTSLDYLGVESNEVDIIMGTMSKTLCSEGGFICGNKQTIENIRRKARSYIFSAAPDPAAVGAALGALELISESNQYTIQLQDNIKYFSYILKNEGINCNNVLSAIFPIIIGDKEKLAAISNELFDRGIFVPTVVYPAVKVGNERLRFSLMATHTKDQLDYTVRQLKLSMQKHGIM